jgi:hypothetical protein
LHATYHADVIIRELLMYVVLLGIKVMTQMTTSGRQF